LKMHAASGNVNVQAQSAPFTLTAQNGIDLQSTAGSIVINAPSRIVLNGGGSYIKIEGGDIEIGTSGAATFKGAMKELAGGSSASSSQVNLAKSKQLFDEQFRVLDQESGEPMSYYKYRIENSQGEVLARGITDQNGHTTRVHTSGSQQIRIVADEE